MSDKTDDQSWVTATTKVHDSHGICARPAEMLVKIANRFSGVIHLEKEGEKVNGKSVMGVMMLAAGPGSEIIIHAKGMGAKTVVEEIVSLLSRDFDVDWSAPFEDSRKRALNTIADHPI